ncbi:hypothetical protein [Methylocystis suflitae]|uniref:hypothetical protein n=1 Tax=Methylocystis suflitae TaxID=2951405 RepID=UPI00210D6C8C|nr:hypothetical protein [Methylocystis suflitae]MCQ4189407.1 hypothetical protein [Methylocystis suflitae]
MSIDRGGRYDRAVAPRLAEIGLAGNPLGREADRSARSRNRFALPRGTRPGSARHETPGRGTARLRDGDYDQVVGQIADFYIERTANLRTIDKALGVTITTLTNAEADDVSQAIRVRLKQRGLIGGDETIHKAVYYRGDKAEFFDLPIATGDKLRLYRRTFATFDGRGAAIGNNVDVVLLPPDGWRPLPRRCESYAPPFLKTSSQWRFRHRPDATTSRRAQAILHVESTRISRPRLALRTMG